MSHLPNEILPRRFPVRFLAIDTSCDESSVAILELDSAGIPTLRSNVVASHVSAMERFGGVVPEVASREHLRVLPLAVEEALQEAGLSWEDLHAIAATDRPGLIGALLVGISFAKAAAWAAKKPYFGIDHIEGHLFTPCLSPCWGAKVPPFPWVALVVSGGHTELYVAQSVDQFEHLGGTLDDAAGEAFDKIGKILGLGYPAGPKIDKWVREKASEADRKALSLPRAKLPGFDFSFSGLKTAVLQELRKATRRLGIADSEVEHLPDTVRLQVAASAQEAIVDALVAKTLEAAEKKGAASIVVTGGVACNSRLRERLPMAHFPPPRFCADNAAMIAWIASRKWQFQNQEGD